MKKLLLILLVILPIFINAQNKETKQKFADYTEKGYYKIDGSNIVVSVVINDVSGTKDDIYIKVKNFFTRAYKDANSVLQTDDKDAGVIIGKGYFRDVYSYKVLGVANPILSVNHILRVDIKDGRVRVICSADTWESTNSKGVRYDDRLIIDYAPITDKRFFDKGKQMEAFINLVDIMHLTINSLEKSIKEGSISDEAEDW